MTTINVISERDPVGTIDRKRLSETEADIRQRHDRGEYGSALEIAESALSKLRAGVDRLEFAAACLRSLIGERQRAMDGLRAAMQAGLWWPAEWLDTDPDLDALRGTAEWSALVAECQCCRARAQAQARCKLFVNAPLSAGPREALPCVFAIHWRGDNALAFGEAWQWLAQRGYVLALPQSSQVFGIDTYCWDDLATAMSDLRELWAALAMAVPCDPERTCVAGVSQGGARALEFVIKMDCRPLPPVIAIVPWGTDPLSLVDSLGEGRNQRLRGAIWTGTEDPGYEDAKVLHRELQLRSCDYELIVGNGLGHTLPKDFERSFLAVLARLDSAHTSRAGNLL